MEGQADWPEIQPSVERGVLDLIAEDQDAPAVESQPVG